VQTAMLFNKNSFWQHSQQRPFSTKTNPRENRKFAGELTIGGEKGTHNVKKCAEIFTQSEI
jgi:hypothetical protein